MERIPMTEAQLRALLKLPGKGRKGGKGKTDYAPYKNKLERDYAAYLDQQKSIGAVAEWWYEPGSFKLAHKCYYHYDFLVQMPDGTLEVHETKGFMRDDANVKCKVAAHLYACYVFRVVYYKQRQWVIHEVSA
jgi:hypothetical protein